MSSDEGVAILEVNQFGRTSDPLPKAGDHYGHLAISDQSVANTALEATAKRGKLARTGKED